MLEVQIWEAYDATIALDIYGIVLFPNLDNFVDMIVIGAFLTKNPMPTLLVDVLYYLSWRNAKRGRMVTYCAPLLYKWLLTYLLNEGPSVE